MSFTHRRISVTFDGSGQGLPSISLTGHRVHASVTSTGLPGYGTAEVAIYGLTMSQINQLSTFGQPIHPQKLYKMIVEAGDDVNGVSTVFTGTITQAWADFQPMPQVPFHAVAVAQGDAIVQKSDNGQKDWNSYTGQTSVKTMYQNLAGQMKAQLEYHGPDLFLNSPYHFGSPMRQFDMIREAVDHMGVAENGVLAVWPLNQSRPGGSLVVSRDTGMVAYPSFTEFGVLTRVEFTAYAKYGTEFTVKSDIQPANGKWSIIKSEYRLQAEQPGGAWYVDLYGRRADVDIPFPPG